MTLVQTTRYRHPRMHFALALPDKWERMEDTQLAPLIAVEPVQRGFRPNVVVTVDEVKPGVSPDEWHAGSIDLLRQHLNAFWLIDRWVSDMGDWPVRRTVGHHTTDTSAVTVEQWLWFGTDHCFTLTASSNTLEYPDYRNVFTTVAASFDPGEERA